MDLGKINIHRKTGNERFKTEAGSTDISLNEFWQWSNSDLLSNTTRGILAEFIVASALGINNGTRTEWDPYDLLYKDGFKKEVKASAYLQSWHQKDCSKISFDIKPTKAWNPNTNKFEGVPKRQSDVYIFCLLHHKDKSTVAPLNLDQWTFYLLPTPVLDRKFKDQKRLGHKTLEALKPLLCSYSELRDVVNQLMK